MRTVDSLMQERTLRGPYLLKIDVDGAEERILAGAQKTLAKCSVLIVEAHYNNFLQRSRPIEAAGFELFDIVDLCYYDDRLSQFDLVFINSSIVKSLGLAMYAKGFDFSKWKPYAKD
jgi:hypothetical protein